MGYTSYIQWLTGYQPKFQVLICSIEVPFFGDISVRVTDSEVRDENGRLVNSSISQSSVSDRTLLNKGAHTMPMPTIAISILVELASILVFNVELLIFYFF